MTRSLPPAYFEDIYARDPDPWRFATSEYERAKYDATLNALTPAEPFARALEVGCSIGVLTQRLAPLCESLLAIDVAEAALAQARARCAALGHVAFARTAIPQEWPMGTFDLILFSEVLYYLSPDDLAATARLTQASLRPGGTALLVHYTRPTNYPATGDGASEAFIAATGFSPILLQVEAEYRLDLLRS
jgi:SAM-dependent methyltransferase